MIIKCYLFLNLDFLDKEDLGDDAPTENVPTLKVRVIGAKEVPDALRTSTMFFFIFIMHISSVSLVKDSYFCRTFKFLLSDINVIHF